MKPDKRITVKGTHASIYKNLGIRASINKTFKRKRRKRIVAVLRTRKGNNADVTTIKKLGNIKGDAIEYLKKIEKEIVKENHEVAIVVTKYGEVYRADGGLDNVDITALGNKLVGASVTHNHPDEVTEYSFSDKDFILFLEYKLNTLRGCDNKYEYEFNRNPKDIDEYPAMDDENPYRHFKTIQECKNANIGYRRKKR